MGRSVQSWYISAQFAYCVEGEETVRKVSQTPVALPYRAPRMALLTDFGLLIVPECTFGALLRRLFGQSLRRSWVAFIRYSSRVPKTNVFDATPGGETLRQGDGLPSVTSTGYSWKLRLRGEVTQEAVRTLLVIVVIIVLIVVAYLLLSRRRR
jgi:hypothetical protein